MNGLLIPYLGSWVLELRYLRNSVTKAYIIAANQCQLTSLVDRDGNQVTGASFPVNLTYAIGADHPGTWRATLPATLDLEPGEVYKATLEVDADGAIKSHRELSLLCRTQGQT